MSGIRKRINTGHKVSVKQMRKNLNSTHGSGGGHHTRGGPCDCGPGTYCSPCPVGSPGSNRSPGMCCYDKHSNYEYGGGVRSVDTPGPGAGFVGGHQTSPRPREDVPCPPGQMKCRMRYGGPGEQYGDGSMGWGCCDKRNRRPSFHKKGGKVRRGRR